MSFDNWPARVFVGTGIFIALLAMAGLYTGPSGGPLSLAVFSLGFAGNVLCTILGGLGLYDPDLPHEWLKIELPRWVWAVVLFPYGVTCAAIAWWTYTP